MLSAADFTMKMGLFSPAKEFAPMRLEVWHEFYVAAPDHKQLLVHVVGCFDDPVLDVVEPSPVGSLYLPLPTSRTTMMNGKYKKSETRGESTATSITSLNGQAGLGVRFMGTRRASRKCSAKSERV
jgi:hypothetical protein